MTVSLIGEGFSLRRLARRRQARRLDRAGGEHVAGDRRGAALQRRLPLEQCVELLLELLLVEQLPAGDAVDLRAQFGDAVLIGELHFRLAADQPRQHVLAEGEIGAGRDRPDRHHHQRADHDPEGDRADAHLSAAMREGVVGIGCVRTIDMRRRPRRRSGHEPDGRARRRADEEPDGTNTTSTLQAGRPRPLRPGNQPADINRIWLKKRKNDSGKV